MSWGQWGYSRSLMYRLRRTALETPSLNRNHTSLLPTATPMRHSSVSFSGASASAGTGGVVPQQTDPSQCPHPTPTSFCDPYTPLLGTATLLMTARPKKSLSGYRRRGAIRLVGGQVGTPRPFPWESRLQCLSKAHI